MDSSPLQHAPALPLPLAVATSQAQSVWGRTPVRRAISTRHEMREASDALARQIREPRALCSRVPYDSE
jgi:hypothetical protein